MSGQAPQILGIGQIPIRTRLPQHTYADLLGVAAHRALEDAGIESDEIDGLVLGQSPTTTMGIDEPHLWAMAGLPGSGRFLGRTHVAAASGLSAFRLACAYVSSGYAKRVLVVSGDLADEAPSLTGSIGQLHDPFTERYPTRNAITLAAAQMSAYMARNKLTERDMALIPVKNRASGVNNTNAQLREALTVEDVVTSKAIVWPVKRLDCSPRSSGAAAVIVGRPSNESRRPAVYATGFGSCAGSRMTGNKMVPGTEAYIDGSELAEAGRRAYAAAGIRRPSEEIGLAEIYASFGVIEMIGISALGLSPNRSVADALQDGEFWPDAPIPVNPSGGATCGSPISSTGLIRVIEATLQLRGEAGAHQVSLRVPRAAVSAIAGAFQTHEVAVLEAQR